MYVQGGGIVKMSGGSISNNIATFLSRTFGGAFSRGGGGGLFVGAGSVTLTGVAITGIIVNVAGQGKGVYQQNNAKVNPNPPGPPNNNLTDNDDPGGNPVKGP